MSGRSLIRGERPLIQGIPWKDPPKEGHPKERACRHIVMLTQNLLLRHRSTCIVDIESTCIVDVVFDGATSVQQKLSYLHSVLPCCLCG